MNKAQKLLKRHNDRVATLKKAEKAVEEAFDSLRHNASMLHLNFGDDYTDDDNHAEFQEWLGRYAADEMKDIEAVLLKRHHEKLTLAQYGRSGATVAPQEWTRDNTNGLCLDWSALETSTYPLSRNLRYLRHVVATLETLNREVKHRVKAIPAAWHEYLQDGDIPESFGTHQYTDIG